MAWNQSGFHQHDNTLVREYLYSAINRDVALRQRSNTKTKMFWVHAENCYN